MSGFITESVSKISDGFGSAVKLLVFVLLSTLAVTPIRSLFGLYGVIGLILLLFLLAIYYLYSSIRGQFEETRKAWCGMASGVLLWQVTRYLPEIPGLGGLDRIGILYWLGLLLVTMLLWKRVLNTGLKFLLTTFLLNWLGHLYLIYIKPSANWPGVFATVYPYLRYLGIVGVVFVIWWIVTRSQNSIQRKYGGLALYFCVLLTFLFF